MIRVRNPLYFHGSSLPAEALAQAGAPSGQGTVIGKEKMPWKQRDEPIHLFRYFVRRIIINPIPQQ